jgi:pimeloyl-ACP methyl ester carboxylesterase
MVACEVAAAYPARASRLVLLDAIGFWREDAPVTNWMLLNPGQLRSAMFRDADSAAAQRMFTPPDDGEGAMSSRVQMTWAMGATGKFIWPIPDKGLKKRIHRVKAPTLLVWGKDDRLVPPVYAEEFTRRIAGARVETVDGAGHAPQLEQPETVARLIHNFLTRESAP